MTLCLEINKNKKSDTLDMVEDEGVVIVRGFMRKELKLEKTELIVYAIIYGFHTSGCSFTGSVKYLSEWSGSGRTAVKGALRSLEEKGYIIRNTKRVKNIEYNEYMINAKCKMQNAK
ncbi:MAG: helix-turn-helix domain-containing protein [Clostridia bacterium]|nr:helix-turn-helix domain-containing protein [Clostridia bacterium]